MMKKILSIVLCLCLFLALYPCSFAEYNQIDEHEISLIVNGNETKGTAIEASYEGNTYLSLRSLAEALRDTEKNFNISYGSTTVDGTFFEITTGENYNPVEKKPNEEEGAVYLEATTNRIFFNGAEKKYYTYQYDDPEDLYMSLTDVQLLFNLGIEVSGERQLTISPDRSFAASLEGLDGEGYFRQFNAVLTGTKDGKVLYSYNGAKSYPVASVSKLMSYLVVEEAIKSGILSSDDIVTISENAAALAASEDGRLEMSARDEVPFTELMEAMLVMSSNEAALAIAEHTYGSESAFVDKMNERAKELKLYSSKFYNCNGLPLMTTGSIPTKLQNRMSANDLFKLCSYILNNYPEITEITSQQLIKLDTLNYASWNSNTLVFNVDGVSGLKTGSTKASGSCVAACNTDGKIVIVLGAEDSAMRGRAAEILFRAS